MSNRTDLPSNHQDNADNMTENPNNLTDNTDLSSVENAVEGTDLRPMRTMLSWTVLI